MDEPVFWLNIKPMYRLLTIAALVLSLGIPSAEAAKRVALVIGNDSYKSLPNLNNARTDARGMAAKLKELGWSVILRQDASLISSLCIKIDMNDFVTVSGGTRCV